LTAVTFDSFPTLLIQTLNDNCCTTHIQCVSIKSQSFFGEKNV
jgi:hypothetical protein